MGTALHPLLFLFCFKPTLVQHPHPKTHTGSGVAPPPPKGPKHSHTLLAGPADRGTEDAASSQGIRTQHYMQDAPWFSPLSRSHLSDLKKKANPQKQQAQPQTQGLSTPASEVPAILCQCTVQPARHHAPSKGIKVGLGKSSHPHPSSALTSLSSYSNLSGVRF